MSSIDRIMKRRRTQEYKYLKMLFKARDKARPYLKGRIRISILRRYFRGCGIINAIDVIDHQHYIIDGPPKPSKKGI